MNADRDFHDWASTHWGSLVRSAVFLGCSVHEAQDLAQATLVRCWSRWRLVQRADDRDAYVFRILLNQLRDSRRRRSSTERPTDDPRDTSTPDPATAYDVADTVHRALATLTPEQREVVVLRYLVDLSERQAAEVLGVPPGTVKSRLSRALAQLALDDHLSDLRPGGPR